MAPGETTRESIATAALELYKDSLSDDFFCFLCNPENKIWLASGLQSFKAFHGPARFREAERVLAAASDGDRNKTMRFFFATFATAPLRATSISPSPWCEFPDLLVVEPKHQEFSGAQIALDDPPSAPTSAATPNPMGSAAAEEPEFYPGQTAWGLAFDQAQILLAEQELRKIVLARSSETPWLQGSESILERIVRAVNPHGYTFFLRWRDSIFFGLSPERLFQLEANCLRTHALAGTRGKGEGGLSAEANCALLRRSLKDQDEHAWVVRFLKESLVARGANVQVGEQIVRSAGNLWHLETPLKAEFSETPNPLAALAALHPTPATCGFPVDRAQKELAQIEAFDRGLYAGAIGVMQAGGYADACVALRSALLRGKTVFRYAGAGIVRESQKDAEFHETERKLATIAKLLGQERQ